MMVINNSAHVKCCYMYDGSQNSESTSYLAAQESYPIGGIQNTVDRSLSVQSPTVPSDMTEHHLSTSAFLKIEASGGFDPEAP